MTPRRFPFATPSKVLLLLAAVGGTGLAAAQYVGPSNAPAYRSIADVLKNPVDDAQVLLDGYLVQKVGSDKYLLSDGTSQIRVEIDNRLFPTTPIHEKTKVRIRGEVEKDFLESPEVDVDQLQVVVTPQ